jgi:predicted molibdopterin-dependent oxidoreductase YjgC
MADAIKITVDGEHVRVGEGVSLAAALMMAGRAATRRSVGGEERGPLCGMGICFECRVTVDGERHVRSCQTLCREGMEVRTTDA